LLGAVLADDGQIYVSVRHMCEALEVDRRGQVRRIQRNEILAEGYKGGAMMAPPSSSGRGGGLQQAALLRVDLVPLWLSGAVQRGDGVPNRVAPNAGGRCAVLSM